MSRPKIVIKSKSGEEKKPPAEEPKKTAPQAKVPKVNPPVIEADIPEANVTEDTGDRPRKKIKLLVPILATLNVLLLAGLAYLYFFSNAIKTDHSTEDATSELVDSGEEDDNVEVALDYDSIYDDFEKDILGDSKTFDELLNDIGVAGADINMLKKKIKGYNLRRLKKGDKFSIYNLDDQPALLLVEPKITPYYKYEINLNSLIVKKVKKIREIKLQETAAIVETNLGITFINNNLNLKLIQKLEAIFQYSVDLFQVDDGDRFKILYEQEFLDGKPYEVLGIKAAFIQEGNRKYYAFLTKEGNRSYYYNEFGESLKRSFLSSPIKYGGVVTSGFGLRVHPKLGYRKMHLGTDYAAPEGTPIVAVADAVVAAASQTTDSGNFVKLTHDKVYETQYLHMQKFHPNTRVGRKVKQGDVIGYVGMTGLATGPHVCYRFKKNGEQVNPNDNNNGTSSKIPNTKMTDYMNFISPIKSAIKRVEYF